MSQTQPNSVFDGRRIDTIPLYGGSAQKLVSIAERVGPDYAFTAEVILRNGSKALWISSNDSVGSSPGFTLAANETMRFTVSSNLILWAVLADGESNWGQCDVAVIVSPVQAKLAVVDRDETVTRGIW